ncbi:MAG: Dihydrofolate reductase [Candidatus Gottesmanbacteria bacterium GW2011_GWA1_34_13]|uniref:Dihydrofolate reductase n=1 Tax=Candidatus Gottesmanbacteria bacterium GW2011_GWA1_34_13 TaxID=1618434 RepID=A0A0G0D7R0_9BACT|nr:MAG: Dihydrofolate reductase [Candidatus Gottesmanbacteria bacterium GW2011_GWA1_34_13]
MITSIIAAIGENRELGKNKQLLWHISEDLKHFKQITQNHPVIMGRTTFESIGKPLPNRTNIIVTHNANYQYIYSSNSALPNEKLSMNSSQPAKQVSNNKTIIVHSLEEAINLGKQHDQQEIFIIGGGQIYKQAIKVTDKLYLTIVHGNFDADTFFPDYSAFNKVIKKEELKTPKYDLTFFELEKS